MNSATPPGLQTQDSPLAKALAQALAQALPKGFECTAWHVSTTPAVTEALCYPPALKSTTDNRPSKPLKTYCEKQFLAVSIVDPTKAKDVLVLGLEIYIYTTAFTTTIFVAKADSTGYLHLQSAPRGFSPIRAITAAFLDFLVENRRRPSKQLIINLFARAQSQYIFPGSVKNNKKHILDDRGLIKWWCRVLNPLLEGQSQGTPTRIWDRIHGYLVIPGLDRHETNAFIPKVQDTTSNWSLGHPLELISPYTKDAANYGNVPPRCLIPTYPDDPKARFVEELEQSTSDKAKLLGGWKAPGTLDQFWEMMAFRQECSSGRMTGFVWLVFEPPLASATPRGRRLNAAGSNPIGISTCEDAPSTPKAIASLKFTSSPLKSTSASGKLLRRKRRGKNILKGPIVAREPRVKTHRVKYPDQIETPYYYWPEAGRGQVVLDDNGYKRAVELLLHLEFKSLEQAIASTLRWTSEVNMSKSWALPIFGEKTIPDQLAPTALRIVNNLTGSIQKKRKSDDESSQENASGPVNMLGKGLLRKKPKVDADEGSGGVHGATGISAEPNILDYHALFGVLVVGLTLEQDGPGSVTCTGLEYIEYAGTCTSPAAARQNLLICVEMSSKALVRKSIAHDLAFSKKYHSPVTAASHRHFPPTHKSNILLNVGRSAIRPVAPYLQDIPPRGRRLV
ncbi:hypothetical protein NUW58_g4704 [Xylaria curta]|uniref:Uncharacterized protein n=1 Tax=Xylaria curta TaxID=42375 RepID=A0ACC1P567_9PEZI|nr:hypothetical protein NUW58_g4704 [Xylaria curta]